MDAVTEQPVLEFPEKLAFLLTTACRYKCLYGGRGAGKTVNIARALVILANQRKLRILCGREFQNSIRESVYETLKEQIISLGLIKEFEILATSIVSKRTGSEFLFKGLRHNIESIKSLASIDIVWIEEANNISKVTWDKLTPTIRGRSADDPRGNIGPFGKGPEIWISFNPELDSDETYKRFVLNPPSKYDKNGNLYSIVEKVNWSDNVWFPDDLREEMEQLRAKDENKWLEVWEGHTKQVLDGAIYAEEIRQAILEKRIGKVPYDPNRPVNTFWDLGRADKTAIWFGQTVGLEFNLINYYEDSLKKMPFYIKVLQDLGYNYGIHFLPHDGAAETLSNVTPQRQLINVGYKTRIVERPAKKFLGINAARSIFPLCNFDEANTPDGLQCLKRYCYKINEDTGTFGKEPDHDTPWSHGCFTGDTKILTRDGPKCINTLPKTGEVWTQFGWKNYFNPHVTRKNASLVAVHFTDGFMVKCTPDHLFLTEKGWKSAKNLEKGMLIQYGLTKLPNFSKEKSTEFIQQNNILKQTDLCIDMYGQMLLDQYQKVVISIIKMKINIIINWIISNVFLGKNIYNLAGNYILKEAEFQNLPKQLELKQQSGINQKKVKLGILSKLMKQNHGKKEKELFSIVWSAVNLLKHWIRKDAEENIAQLNVDMFCLEGVETLNEKSDVWCLTVPECGHFALANGAIVKNCDAFQTMALAFKSEKASQKPKTVSSGRVIKLQTNTSAWMR